MIFVPLPFVTALLLAILLIQMMRQSDADWRANPFVVLLGAHVLLSVVIGLRWGYDVRAIMPLQGVLATLTPALAWLSFRSLTVERPVLRWSSVWPHLLPAGLVLALVLFWPTPVGLVIMLSFLGYGGGLLWLTRKGPDSLVATRLDGVLRSYRALQITAFATLASPLTDIAISIDMLWAGGVHAAAVVAGANVVGLLILGTAASVAGSMTVAPAEEENESLPAPESEPEVSGEERSVAEALDALMASKQLYKDTDLNLGRIARRLNLPARRVSSAVNRIHAMSVSHYVNNYRIAEACRLLEATDESVINVMMDAGFLSKSNFNREFLRVTGTSPAAWRRNNRQLLAAE